MIDQFPSWQMISPGDSVTVSVPDGMTAGYVDNKTFTIAVGSWTGDHSQCEFFGDYL